MRKLLLPIIAIGIILVAVILINSSNPSDEEQLQDSTTSISNQSEIITMKISSPEFTEASPIPAKFTCNGENINPPLLISDVPEGTKSLAIVVDDPDAPAGTWTHWLVWNIDPKTNEIKENSIPENSVSGRTSFGLNKYSGPCPPNSTHRYFFKLIALDTEVNLKETSDIGDFTDAIEEHIINEAELMGVYSKT